MQNKLAEFKLGRIVLHLLCCCQDRNFLWHWRGILRELSKGALLVFPASKCDATESCLENAVIDEAARLGDNATQTVLAYLN